MRERGKERKKRDTRYDREPISVWHRCLAIMMTARQTNTIAKDSSPTCSSTWFIIRNVRFASKLLSKRKFHLWVFSSFFTFYRFFCVVPSLLRSLHAHPSLINFSKNERRSSEKSEREKKNCRSDLSLCMCFACNSFQFDCVCSRETSMEAASAMEWMM